MLDRSFDAGINKAAARIAEISRRQRACLRYQYRPESLHSIKIDSADVATLQRNLILSHCCGVGAACRRNIVRLIMALKLVSLGRGASGVRLELVRLIEGMLEKGGVIPVRKRAPSASGDLAPLAHIAAVMMGEAEAFYKGERLSGALALDKAGLTPVVLAARKPGADQRHTRPPPRWRWPASSAPTAPTQAALITGAMSTDAAMGSSARSHPRHPHAAWPQGPDRYEESLVSRHRANSPGATSRATSASRTPTASAASRRWAAPAWTCCVRSPALEIGAARGDRQPAGPLR